MPQKGFTLIEPMITIAVLAIVLGIAVPSISSILRVTRAFFWPISPSGRLGSPALQACLQGGGHCLVIDGLYARATFLGNAIAVVNNLSIKPAARGYLHNE